MNQYVIYMDMSGDLDETFAREHDILFVPMMYSIGSQEKFCTTLEKEEDLKPFYNAQRKNIETRTSQVTPQQYIDIFTPWLRKGMDILYLSLSSGLTKTFDSVRLAARDLAEDYPDAAVYPVDTLSATGGMGLLAEQAALNREKGLSARENMEVLNELRRKVCHIFMVDDLMYLKRGGRIDPTTALLGTALNIKPILVIDSRGKLPTIKKKRGVKLAMKEMVTDYMAKRIETLPNRVYVVHADCSDRADELISQIRAVNPGVDICKRMLCPVIGAHVGPGMFAVIFFGDRIDL